MLSLAQLQVSRCKDLWYTDGTIVLRSAETVFRVYSGMLAQCSEVFKDLFTVAQPTVDDQDTYEGLPLIVLHDDPKELLSFLKAIHDPRYVIQVKKLRQ